MGQNDSDQLYVLDSPVKYFLRINKYDVETKSMIALAQTTFRMETFDNSKNQWIPYTETYDPGDLGNENIHSTWATDNRGTLSFVNPLPVAKYRLIETKAPTGYLLDSTPVEFTVPAHNTVVVMDRDKHPVLYISKYDKPVKGKITVTKTGQLPDAADTSKTPAQCVYKTGDRITRIVSGADGIATATHLYCGKYYAVETDTIKPYVLDTTKIFFAIKENNPEQDQKLDSILIVENKVNNLRQVKAKIVKQDSENEKALVRSSLRDIYSEWYQELQRRSYH